MDRRVTAVADVDTDTDDEPGVGPVRVLIVDDTAGLRLLMRVVLEEAGFEVVGEAGDGLSGLRLATELRPDLVLLDMAMPVMDGLEALPRLRSDVPCAKVVVISGFERQAMERQVMEGGADAYLQKGLGPDEILAVLYALFPDDQEEIRDVTLAPDRAEAWALHRLAPHHPGDLAGDPVEG